MEISDDPFSRLRFYIGKSLAPFNWSLLIALAANALVLVGICRITAASVTTPNCKIWNLFAVATAAIGAGGLIGFLYAPYGDEKARFSDVSKVIMGLLGGFSITEIAKNDGLIRRFFTVAALSCGGPDTKGILIFVMLSFGTLGFLGMYFNKSLALNPALDAVVRVITPEAAREKITETVSLPRTQIGSKPELTGEAKLAASYLRRTKEIGKSDKLKDIRADAKALYGSGIYDEAIELLKKGLETHPDDPVMLFDLSHLLITVNRPLEALTYLHRLQKIPSAPIETLKLLGYCYLFNKDTMDKSIEASLAYLQLRQQDTDAEFNIACAYAMKSEQDPRFRAAMEQWLDRVLREDPSYKERIQRYLNKDFKAFANDPEFKRKYL